MLPSCETNVDLDNISHVETSNMMCSSKRERSFPTLDLTETTTSLNTNINQPILVIQSPKTPTLSRKLKAVSLDSDPLKSDSTLNVARDVSSMPNTPKKQNKTQKSLGCEDNTVKPLLTTSLGSNLKKFASNTSISGSQTLKTLPEVMTLQDFIDGSIKPEPIRIKAKGLLERRGSNASLTIDLGSSSNITEGKTCNKIKLNSIKSASHINLTSFSSDQCSCASNVNVDTKSSVKNRHSHQDYEGASARGSGLCRNRCYTFHKKCNCLCNFKCRRKSLSNENLYVPPCSFCQSRLLKEGEVVKKNCNGCRRAVYPRQPNTGCNQILSDDFKMHLQNVQYLQTAGSVLSISDLKTSCQMQRVPKLHQEFWEVPLNLQEKCIVSGSQSKNRYKGVLPNEHSRVHLAEPSTYIHANYIKGHDYVETAYIATQGPMEHTCGDFWEMVWASESNCIVMLTGLVEKGKSKCELYFPLGKSQPASEKSYFYVTTTKAQDKFTFEARNVQVFEEETIAFEELDQVTFGSYKIEFCKLEKFGECQIRQLKLEKEGIGSRLIFHYWFSNWQDHKMANPVQVLDIALHVFDFCERRLDNNLKSKKQTEDKKERVNSDASVCNVPVIVHCSAGIGRTGCFLAILNGIRQIKSNCNVDVLAILCSLRLHRGGMVQTAEQYELIHRVLCLYINKIESDII